MLRSSRLPLSSSGSVGAARKFVLAALTAIALGAGCERPATLPTDITISGYQIRGSVRDRVGNPVRGVNVKLYYDYDFYDYGPEPSRTFTVVDSTQIITASVVDRKGMLVQILASGRHPLGTLAADWDGRDSSGVLVPSNVYTVQFTANGNVLSSYAQVVEGSVVARTDVNGGFVILDNNLPIGVGPVPVYLNDVFQGLYQIRSDVLLEFATTPVPLRVQLLLEQNVIKQVAITF